MLQILDQLADGEIKAGRAPSVAIGITVGSDIRYAAVAGLSDLGGRQPANQETVYSIGSLTKQFTATTIVALAREDLIELDATVDRYIEEFPPTHKVTIRQLLEHRSGLIAQARMHPNVRSALTLEQLCRHIRSHPIERARQQFRYNNIHYLLLATVIERTGGGSYANAIRMHVTDPVGLTRTSYLYEGVAETERALGYTGIPGQFRPAPQWDPTWLSGAGGLTASVSDLMRWNQHILNHPSDGLRTYFGDPADSDRQSKYVMGWLIDRVGGQRYIWHNGAVAGYRAMSALFPVQRLTVVALCNVDSFVASYVTSPRHLVLAAANVVSSEVPSRSLSEPSVIARLTARVRDAFHRKYLAPSERLS